jgi:hypothetical protein
LRAPAPLCHLLFARKLLQFVVFSPQVERARAPLFSLLLGSFCNLWFLSSGWESKSSFVLLVTRKLLQFVVFSPQVERARAPLFSLLLGSFCNLWFLSSGWESKSFFAISLFARKLLQFLVFSPQVERARVHLPSPCLLESFCNFWFYLLRLRGHRLLCHLLLLWSFCSLVIIISFARKLFVTDHARLLLKELS